MTDTAPEFLPDLVARLQARVNELRRAGDHAVLLAAANSAADEIERRVGERWNNGEGRGDEERQALTAVKRFTFNAAADCWPGWSLPAKPPDTPHLVRALELAQRSARLVEQLGLGPLQEGTGIWLCGAFELALGRYTDASSAFTVAREKYITANALGLTLLMEGYSAIVREIAGHPVPVGGEDLHQVSTRIAAGGFEDGEAWIEQLHTALKVFAPSS